MPVLFVLMLCLLPISAQSVGESNDEMNWSSDEMRLHPDTNGNGKMPN
jgi:hypothetical protein